MVSWKELYEKAQELKGKTETFDLGKLKSAKTNLKDTINALESDPPKVASALTNAKDALEAVERAINMYDDDDNYPRKRYRGPIIVTPPPPPPSTP